MASAPASGSATGPRPAGPARPRAVLFDHDGVLVASEPLHWSAWGALLKELGLPYHESELRALVGKTAPQILRGLLDRHRPGWTEAEFDLNALALRKNDFYLRSTGTELRAYPGVREGIEWLRSQGIKVAVVSNAKRRELEAGLKSVNLFELMDVVVSRDDAPAPKPDPAPYLMAAAELGIEPGDCLAVEDAPPGIEAALVGRIPAAAVLTNFSRAVMEQPVPGRPDLKPVRVFDTIAELFVWLRGF